MHALHTWHVFTYRSAILDVTLTDTVDAEAFDVVFGSVPAHWSSIGPGANVTHVVVLSPKAPGTHNFTGGQLTYKTAADADPVVRTNACI